jgi:hypothetical protein
LCKFFFINLCLFFKNLQYLLNRKRESDICVKIYSVNIKFGTKFVIMLSDSFKKIARAGRFYFEKCRDVMCSLFK